MKKDAKLKKVGGRVKWGIIKMISMGTIIQDKSEDRVVERN